MWARIAATSLAMKLSSPCRPTTSGTSWRAPTSRLISPLVHDDERVGALELAEGRPDGVGEVALVGLLDEVGDRLGVGLRRQGVAARLEPVAELAEVLDDPVVDDRDVAGAVLVGMGVQVVRPAVGRPARVGEADRGVRRPIGDRGLEVGELAGLLLDEQVAVLVDEGDPRRVVAAVLEPLEALDQDRARLPGSRVADDAAHVAGSPPRPAAATAGPSEVRGGSARPPRGAGGVSLVARPRGSRSRRPARPRASASGPSTMTRRAGSVPDGRTRTRPPPPSRASASRIARWIAGSPSHWSLWRAFTARCCWGSSGIRAGELGERPAGPGHDPEDLERGDDAVAGRRVLEDDHVAALLAAEAGARDLHPLEDVLVADRRPDHLAAGRLDGRLEAAVREDRDDEGALGQHAALEPVEGEDARGPGRRRRSGPPRRPRSAGRRRRRGRTRRPRRARGPPRRATPARSRRTRR